MQYIRLCIVKPVSAIYSIVKCKKFKIFQDGKHGLIPRTKVKSKCVCRMLSQC